METTRMFQRHDRQLQQKGRGQLQQPQMNLQQVPLRRPSQPILIQQNVETLIKTFARGIMTRSHLSGMNYSSLEERCV